MAHKRSKRYREALKKIETGKTYELSAAAKLLTELPRPKFDETVEVAFRLGVDPRQSDQMVRGTVALPNGSGRQVKVLVFAKDGPSADAAREAGAEFVGFEEYLEKCNSGWVDFDVAVATPEAMIEVRKLGKVLGPRGLMPNPKTGTVTDDTAKAIKEIKAGRVEFKIDKTSNLHVTVGKVSFTPEKLVENAKAVIEAVIKAKPSTSKGRFLKSCALSGTMSPSVPLDLKDIGAV